MGLDQVLHKYGEKTQGFKNMPSVGIFAKGERKL